MRLDRRSVLSLGLSSVACAFWPRTTRSASVARAESEAIDELVRWILATPHEQALRRGARELHAGLDPQLFLGALLAGASLGISPRGVLNHSAFVVASLEQLTRGASAGQRTRNVLWGLDYLKEHQERGEAEQGHWEWSAPDAQKLPAGELALAALLKAFDDGDPAAADVALVGAVRSLPAAPLDALLAECGARSRAGIGHRAIYAAQSRRALPLAGATQRENVLRALVAGGFGSAQSSERAIFEASRRLAADAPLPRTAKARDDAGPARELLAEIRRNAATGLPAVVARLLADGAHPDALWDAIFVGASQVTLGHPGGGQGHAFTSSEALHFLAHDAHDVRIARLALLQAAAWVTLFHAALMEDVPAGEPGLRIESLEPLAEGPGGLFAGTPMERVRRAFAAAAGAESAEKWRAGALQLVREKANEVHEFKVAAAALGVSRTAGAFARPAVLAALAWRLPDHERSDGPELLAIDKAIADAG